VWLEDSAGISGERTAGYWLLAISYWLSQKLTPA